MKVFQRLTYITVLVCLRVYVTVIITVLDVYGTKLEVKRRKRKYLEFVNVTT